ILHRTGDRNIRIQHAQYMADRIPGARLVELPGDDHVPWVGNIDAILDEVEEFLTGVRHVPEPDRVLATLLVTDILGSTEAAPASGRPRSGGRTQEGGAGGGPRVAGSPGEANRARPPRAAALPRPGDRTRGRHLPGALRRSGPGDGWRRRGRHRREAPEARG